MAAVPFMPLYIADYMADTAHLSTVEHGAYLLLIMTYWQRGEALPADDKKLARIAGLQGRNWARVKTEIAPFFEFRDNKWVHQRVELQLSLMRSQSRTNSLNGKKGGLANARISLSETEAKSKRSLSHTDTDTYSSVAKATGASADSDAEFWDSAKQYVGGKNPGALVGRWCRDHGQEATAKAITEAQLNRPADRVPYIEKVLRRRKAQAEELPIC